MDKVKKQRLEKKGWKVGSAQDFLSLSPEELVYIELKLEFGESIKERREQQHLTQVELARRLKSSQSRIAKMEAGDASVSLDLLIRSLIALGATRSDLAQAIDSQ
jgi:ribosome-binding protein aMBF1 (putative translation factor)